MLKGIAPSDGDTYDDRYAVVVELARLSKILNEAQGEPVYTAAAETGATLLRVPKTVVFVRNPNGEMVAAGSMGLKNIDEMVRVSRRVAESSIASASPVQYSKTSSKDPEIWGMLATAGLASVLCVPMRVGESSVGAIVAMSDVERVFSPSDVELLHVIASQTALAVWRSTRPQMSGSAEEHDDLIKQAQRQIQELSLINRVSEAVSSTLDLNKLMDIALEQSMTSVQADAGSLMLISEDTGRLEIAASRGLARRWVEHTSQHVGSSIAGWVAEHGESVLVSNAHADNRFHMTHFRDTISSAASVPLKTKSGITGVLNVNTTNPDKVFNERDLEILGTLANQMAVAIENARLYARVNRRTKQLDSLLQVSKTVTSTLNLDDILHRLTEEVARLFQLDVCTLLIFDDLSGRFRFGHGHGLRTRRKYKYYDLAAPLAARVRRTGSRLVLRDINTSQALITEAAQSENLKAAMCFPLKESGKLVGVVAGFAKESRTFPKSQKDIMRPLGELAGVAIRNARIYRQKYRIAELLKQRLVPSSAPEIRGLDIGHKCLPAREVGGDYYDFVSASSSKIGIVVGDVSGNDVEAAEFTTMGKYVLRAYARECESPGAVLTKTNNLICEDTSAELFLSLFYAMVDLDRMKLTYANAGCEPPILYRARDRSVITLATDGILLGIRTNMAYEERQIDLESGDILFVYTDGLTEAGVDNRRFGKEPVMDIISANAHLGAQQLAELVHDTLIEFVHGRLTDDTTIVVLKVS